MKLNEKQQQAVDFIESPGFKNFYGVFGAGGTGKAQPLDELVLTPSGFVEMRSIEKGDYVISENGNAIKVLKTFSHKMLEMYEITFSDGVTVRCCKDHLWQVQTRKLKINNKFKVMPTVDMIPFINREKKTDKAGHYYCVQLNKPVIFCEKEQKISPWTLGYILGNGCSQHNSLVVSIGSQDIDYVLSMFSENEILSSSVKSDNVGVISLKHDLRKHYENDLKLSQVKSVDKWIPENYLMGYVEQRKMLLAGLLDSDGCCINNKASFSTSSEKLANDFLFLVRSLGGKAKVCSRVRGGRYKNTEYSIQFRTPFNPFLMPRKANNYTVRKNDVNAVKHIISIKKIDDMAGKCLLVDSNDHLYLTTGFTVTHNTTAIKSISDRFRVAFTAPTNKAVKVLKNSGCPPEHCMTIYKFLGLVVNEATGKVTIDKKGKCHSSHYDVLVVDECSMLNTEICNRLRQLINIKVVLLGDYAQLPPTKEKQSPVFNIICDNHIVLTEQMRQKNAQNPLLTLLSDVRKCQDDGLQMVKFSDYKGQIKDEEQGLNVGVVTTKNRKQWELWMLKAVDDTRGFDTLAVAYRNSRVDELNTLIHNHRYQNSDIFCVGERIVFQRPYKKCDTVIADNGDIEIVTRVERVQEFVRIGQFKVMIDALKINDIYTTPIDRTMFNNWISGLMNALNNPRETAGFSWGELYLVRDRFADLRHGYCSTVHKAQGSTVDNVFIDMTDVLTMPDTQDIVNRCIYTALSRARFNAIILE